MTIAPETTFVGIDVASCELVAAGPGPIRRFANDASGIAACRRWLASLPAPLRVGFEATGGYEHELWAALDAAGIRAGQLNPGQVRAFARLQGRLAKTDPCDARLIAAYMAGTGDEGRRLPSEKVRRLRGLCTKRRQILAMRKTAAAQARHTADSRLRAIEAEQIALFDNQIDRLDRLIAETIAADPELARNASLLTSIPAIGPVNAATLMAEMPELGTLSESQLAALAGLAPIARDSGRHAGKRFIQGGRKPVRDALFCAARVAERWNPQLKAFADAKKASKMAPKQITCAVARKLLVIANAVLKRGTPWQHCPPRNTVATVA